MPKGIYKHKKRPPFSEEWRKRMSAIKTGRVLSNETKKKMSEANKGEKNGRWVKDRTKLQRYSDSNKERRSSIYRDWRSNVYKRDNFKCKINNSDCNGRLEAHHILGFKEYPELKYDINNGITLCHFHHPRVREEEKRMIPIFKELVSVSKE